VRLTQAALETLCIIAYKQPLTRAEIEAIRGVEVIGPLETLSQRKLITVVGRRETIGRPILYGTTSEFLRQFGLNSLDGLPKLETFNIENAALGAQSTAVELIDEETAVETIAEGEPPSDPVQTAGSFHDVPTAEEAAAEAPAQEAAPEQPVENIEPVAEAAEAPAQEPVEAAVSEQPAEAAPEEPRGDN